MATIGEMLIKVGFDIKDVDKQKKSLLDKMDDLARQLKRTGRDLTQVLTVPIAAAATAIISQSDLLKKEFTDFGSSMGKIFKRVGDDLWRSLNVRAVLNEIIALVNSLARAFMGLSSTTKTVVVGMAAIAAMIGPLLIILSSLASLFVNLVKLGVVAWLIKASYVVLAFVTSLAALKVALAAGIAIVLAYIVPWQKLKNAVMDAINAVRSYKPLGGPVQSRAGSMTDKEQRVDESQRAMHAVAPVTMSAPTSNFSSIGIVGSIFGEIKDKIQQATYALKDWGQASLQTARSIGAVIGVNMQAISSVRQAGYEYELSGNKVQQHQQILDALKNKYIELRTLGVSPTSESMKQLRTEIEAQETYLSSAQAGWDMFMQKMGEVNNTAIQLANALYGMYEQISSGIGNMLAQVIVYGASFAKALKALLKQIAAYIIETLVKLIVQKIIYTLLGGREDAAAASTSLQGSAIETYGKVFATYASIPFVGPALGAAAGAAAVGALIGGAIASGGLAFGASQGSMAASYTGGMYTRPDITTIGERGPEIVLNKQNVRDFISPALEGTGRGNQTIQVYLDSETIIDKVVRGTPAFLKLHGAI